MQSKKLTKAQREQKRLRTIRAGIPPGTPDPERVARGVYEQEKAERAATGVQINAGRIKEIARAHGIITTVPRPGISITNKTGTYELKGSKKVADLIREIMANPAAKAELDRYPDLVSYAQSKIR